MQAIWTGTISFGLIHIPIRLYSASMDRSFKFHLLRKKDLCPIHYVRICKGTGEEVSYDEIVKGFEYRKGDFIVFDNEDLKKADMKRTTTIEILKFIKESEINEEIIDKPYYIQPGADANKAYVLLREALKSSGKVGIGQFVLRNKERLVTLVPKDNILMINTLRFKDELRDPKELNIPDTSNFTKKELDIAIELIEQMTEPFKYREYKDTYNTKIKEMIDAKAKGKTFIVHEEAPAFTADVTDIMGKLKKSLDEQKAKRNHEHEKKHV